MILKKAWLAVRTGKVLERLSDNTVAVTLGPGDGTLLEVIGQD
jgi:hypothetical protein